MATYRNRIHVWRGGGLIHSVQAHRGIELAWFEDIKDTHDHQPQMTIQRTMYKVPFVMFTISKTIISVGRKESDRKWRNGYPRSTTAHCYESQTASSTTVHHKSCWKLNKGHSLTLITVLNNLCNHGLIFAYWQRFSTLTEFCYNRIAKKHAVWKLKSENYCFWRSKAHFMYVVEYLNI
jgi:hypothetical protein